MKNHPMDFFARNKKSGHPNWIFKKRGNYYVHICITHSDGDGKNIPLHKNPNPKDNSQAYIKPNPEESRTNYKTMYPDWKFSEEDKQTIEQVKKKPPKKTANKKKRETT